jgi:hypothetical protein
MTLPADFFAFSLYKNGSVGLVSFSEKATRSIHSLFAFWVNGNVAETLTRASLLSQAGEAVHNIAERIQSTVWI